MIIYCVQLMFQYSGVGFDPFLLLSICCLLIPFCHPNHFQVLPLYSGEIWTSRVYQALTSRLHCVPQMSSIKNEISKFCGDGWWSMTFNYKKCTKSLILFYLLFKILHINCNKIVFLLFHYSLLWLQIFQPKLVL